MANIKLHDTYQIAEHWVCPLEYGDYTGLSDEEVDELHDFIETLPRCAIFQYGDHTFFGKDKISGLGATCLDVDVYYDAKDGE